MAPPLGRKTCSGAACGGRKTVPLSGCAPGGDPNGREGGVVGVRGCPKAGGPPADGAVGETVADRVVGAAEAGQETP